MRIYRVFRARRGLRATRRDRGSAAIETAVAVPAFMLFVGLIIAGGRLAAAHQAVQSAATEAARTASIARTAAVASPQAATAASRSLAEQNVQCVRSNVSVDVTQFSVPVGQPARTSATVTCAVDLSSLLPFLTGSRDVAATMTSPIDTYRQRT